MNQGRRRFLVASALAPLAGVEGASPVAPAAGNVARIMAAVTLQRQVRALEGLASPHFFPALS